MRLAVSLYQNPDPRRANLWLRNTLPETGSRGKAGFARGRKTETCLKATSPFAHYGYVPGLLEGYGRDLPVQIGPYSASYKHVADHDVDTAADYEVHVVL